MKKKHLHIGMFRVSRQWKNKVYRIYVMRFLQGQSPMAEIYWHPGCKEFVLCTNKDFTLKHETIQLILPYMNSDKFKRFRRNWQKAMKKCKKGFTPVLTLRNDENKNH